MTTLFVPVTAEDHIQGDANAPVELVMYGDYECPYSGKAYPVIKQVQQALGSQLKFIFRNFPLSFHPHALHAAISAEVAGDLGKFWEMHDTLYENQSQLDDAHIIAYVERLGLDTKKFEALFPDPKYIAKMKKDMEGALKSGFNGTPVFYINGTKYNGDYTEKTEMLAYIQTLNV